MRVNVVARGSLASSAAETRTGATTGCPWAVWRPGWWLHPLSPARQDRSAGPGQGYPAGRRPPQAAGPGLPGGSSATAITGRAAHDAREPADAKEPVEREPPVVSAQCLSPSRAGYRTPA